ncbi:hypothetical protein [unidentified bacterial endosymbiont]|uniref:hypothetical protein n=1 Tax=unidentified bacterial endosymbiont TaxID=2355 RepID=UPI0020A2256E|nr:hypothetical protein [unidentified bacterial endosymbiont]
MSKLALFFSLCNIDGVNVSSQNRFTSGAFTVRINVIDNDAQSVVVLTLKTNAVQSDIALRLCQSMRPESIFGVVGSFFFVNNYLSFSCVFPDELSSDDWYRIFEYQKAYMLSFLS